MVTHSRQRTAQRGFSIAELAISTALSLSVIASALTGYLALSTSAMDALAASKLNQDIGALLGVMTNELRRAGYSGMAAPNGANPFAVLAVFDGTQSNLRQPSTGNGSCIVHAYDLDGDGNLAADELAGFRLTADGAVQMRTSGNPVNPATCASQGASWIALTDPDVVTVTALDFDLARSTCVNAGEPDGVDDDSDGTIDDADEADCYAQPPGESDVSVERADVAITLSAQLTHDAFVQTTQTQHVHLRNAVVRRH